MAAISPSLTASSSTTAYNANPYDLEVDFNMDKVQDFSDIFNLLESESSQSQSHSPNTMSPNHTPSPLPGIATPVAVSPTHDFLNFDMDMNQYTTIPKAPEIKEEPVEFGFPRPQADPSPPIQQPAVEEPTNFLGLPVDQQYALQQLLDNMVRYQQQYGLEQANNSGTVQPSMVFNSPLPPQASLPPSQPSTSASVSPKVLKQSPPQSDDELIAIDALEPPTRKERQPSASSMPEDLDAKIESLVPLPAIFSAGRGKGGKKGGGLSSVVRGDDEDIDEDDSWRPSPEEYKKLSSKEKRQLRNKLSARAFRTRRKDYIGTLEAHIKDRDGVIDAIRSELVCSRVEAQDLRRELEMLKKSTMSILHPETATSTSTPPNLMTNFTMPVSLPQGIPEAGPSRLRSATPKFNTRKDLPSTSLDTTKAFWGGSNDFLGGGGSTICHTMFTPDLVLPQTSPIKSMHDLPRININPRLNEEPRRPSPPPPKDDLQGTFQEWSESNAFNLRTMDSYRMQIWSRLAREAAAEKTSMPLDIRPKFYTESNTSAAASLAATATNHVSSKLASSFWSAFTRTGSRSLDSDKLAAVVTGQSRLAVVPTKENDFTDDLVASLSGLRLQSGLGSGEGSGLRARENPLGAISNFVFKLSTPMTRA